MSKLCLTLQEGDPTVDVLDTLILVSKLNQLKQENNRSACEKRKIGKIEQHILQLQRDLENRYNGICSYVGKLTEIVELFANGFPEQRNMSLVETNTNRRI